MESTFAPPTVVGLECHEVLVLPKASDLSLDNAPKSRTWKVIGRSPPSQWLGSFAEHRIVKRPECFRSVPDLGILILAAGTLVMALAVLVIRYASFHYPSEKGEDSTEDA